jgi:transposase-like protein
MDKKVCSKCKEEKEVCEFNKDSSRKDGYDYNCKSCYKQYNLETKIYQQQYHKEYRIGIHLYWTKLEWEKCC